MLPANWVQVLEKIEQALDEALRQAAAREQAAALEAAPEAPDKAAPPQGPADAIERCLGRAGQAVTEADAALAEAQGGLERWLAAAVEVRRKLAA